ncbi:MAG: hypothetical protein M2R45_01803 [Verrucomicrobia subdivision 3 bacterium]|nr:hypothetical protein [Limisphaerales bacterium]MCS1415842.1 hypothetical protein [Limisphaerales bacterium]
MESSDKENLVKAGLKGESAERTVFQKIRETGAHTIIYGIGSALQVLLGFLLIPIYTKYYEASTYGVFALLCMSAAIVGAFFGFGGSNALSRSYYDYPDHKSRRKAVDTAFFIAFAGGFLQVVFGFLFGGWLSERLFHTPEYKPHLVIAFSAQAFAFINTLFVVLLRFERRSKLVIMMSAVSVVTGAAFILTFLIGLKLGVLAPILGHCVTELLLLICYAILCRGRFGVGFNCKEAVLQLRFGFSYVVMAMATYSLDWIDRLILGGNYSLREVGIYAFGCKLGAVIQAAFVNPFGLIWTPVKTQYHGDSNAREFYKTMLTYYFLFGAMTVIVIGVFATEILHVIAQRPEYYEAASVLALIAGSYVLNGALNIVDVGVYLNRRVIVTAFGICLAVVLNFGLNLVAIPRWGYQGAAVVRMATFSFFVVFVFLVSQRFYRLDVEWGRLSVIGVVTVVAVGCTSKVGITDLTYLLGFKVALIVGLMIAGYLLFLTNAERDVLRTKLCDGLTLFGLRRRSAMEASMKR